MNETKIYGAGLAGAAIGAGVGGLAGYGVGNQQQTQSYQQPQQGYYAPPVNNPQCPPGYTCVPAAPQYQQQPYK